MECIYTALGLGRLVSFMSFPSFDEMCFMQVLQNQDIAFSHSLIPLTWLVLISLLLVVFLKFPFSKPVSKTRPPPSPPRLPIIGNFHQIGSSPHRSLAALSANYGPLMLLHLGQKQALVFSSAQTAEQVLKTRDLVFCSRAKSGITAKLLYNYRDVSSAPYGEFWRHVRSLCVVQLLSVKRVQSFRSVREEETFSMVERITESCLKSEPIDLSETVTSLTNDVVCRIALGRKYSDGRFKSLLSRFVRFLGVFNLRDYVPWLNWINKLNGLDAEVDRVAKEFDEFLDQVVRDHQTDWEIDADKEKDFVDVLLGIRHETKSLNMDSIKAIILDMFAGGTDTTSSVLEWGMTELLKHPEVMKKLQDEVRKCGKRDILTEKDLVGMEYLKAVINETLRLHPPIPLLIPREARHAVKLMGYDVAAETLVFVNVWAVGRDPGLWEEPEQFRPERFLREEMERTGQGYKFLPFGAGRRGCPGIAFAMAVGEIALANLVCKFEWKLPGEGRAEDLDMVETTGITIHRKNPLIAVPKLI